MEKIHFTVNPRYNLWKSLINTDEYIDFLNQRPILESGIFDKQYKREYKANFGEHFLSILSALQDAGIDESQYDYYIDENLCIYGKNYNNTNNLQEFEPLIEENKIKPVDKRKIVNDYQKDYWIETIERNK